VKLWACLAALPLASVVEADRLIQAPTGKKIPLGVFRIEHVLASDIDGRYETYVGMGLTREFDAELTLDRDFGKLRDASANFAYNYVDPIADTNPGLSAGVQDAFDRTKSGRRFFLAATFRSSVSGYELFNTPMETSLGLTIGSRWAMMPMVAVWLPMNSRFRLLLEAEGGRVRMGFELTTIRSLTFRWVQLDRQSYWVVGTTQRL